MTFERAHRLGADLEDVLSVYQEFYDTKIPKASSLSIQSDFKPITTANEAEPSRQADIDYFVQSEYAPNFLPQYKFMGTLL